MASITITYKTGSVAGQRVRLDGESLTFGRSGECDVAVPSDAASRTHGRLTATDTGWSLTATGKNRTSIGGKKVGKKPVALRNGDTVSIGDDEVFQVHFEPPAVSKEDQENDNEPAALTEEQLAERKKKRKAKLWIGIGAYLVVMMLAFVFFATLESPEEKTEFPPEWSLDRIESVIREPVTKRPTDEFDAETSLRRATELYNRLETRPSALYEAHEAYQRSLSYQRGDAFSDGLDQLRYQEVQDKLVEQVTSRYRTGYDQLVGGRYARAAETFRNLTQLYPKPESELYQNIERHWATAARLDKQAKD